MKRRLIYSDMADECAESAGKGGYDVNVRKAGDGVTVTTLVIKSAEQSKALDRPKGKYITVDCEGRLAGREGAVQRAVRDALRELAAPLLRGNPKTLVAGLGNRFVTADSLGAIAADGVLAHEKLFALSPGVFGMTGIESLDIIKGVSREINAGLIVVVDTLATARTGRLFKSFQLTDAGLTPGSAAGAGRQTISFSTIGIPVVAVGVPVCIYARSLVYSAVDAVNGKDIKQAAKYDAAFKVLGEDNVALLLTSKEVDAAVSDCARLVAEGINQCFSSGKNR